MYKLLPAQDLCYRTIYQDQLTLDQQWGQVADDWNTKS